MSTRPALPLVSAASHMPLSATTDVSQMQQACCFYIVLTVRSMNKFRNQLSRLSCIQMVLVHRCPHCTRNAIGSLHDCVRRMNEHIGNKHNMRALTTDEFNALEVCEASKTGSKSSYLQVQEVVLSEGFRHESLFEVKAGLLKCNIVFFDGEQRSIGPECQRFFLFWDNQSIFR